ncbi:(2Fe-2S)-binding protein [Streptomyces sp. MUM 2J]|uniref:(2Fe-2S)-binding protein n=1 Tax=Streptomyces sp. MUM 2J TaxID=2791987 RepID=UPI001F042371|nr:(2Fe-2S)-binding protein [Streptomyces sp. MUM 2J]MCH0564944.1 (2Fe-2S)-binding protein [Streptomyces sp. MUM 2J]
MTIAPEVLPADPAATAPGLLADAYRHLAACCEALDVHVAEAGPATGHSLRPAGPWVDAAELARNPDALGAFVDAEATRLQRRFRRAPRRDTAASRALHDYAWSVSLLMSGPWYLHRRVARIHPHDIRVNPATGAFEITPGPGFLCLPGDPAAARLPGVRTLPHEQALHAELRAAVADHMRPLLAAIGPHIRRGQRALWGMVADDLLSGIWHLGRLLGQEEQAVQAATDLLPRAIPPFPGGADFRHLPGSNGRSHTTRTRLGCCLYYTIRPGEACLTCPRTCDAERVQRLES